MLTDRLADITSKPLLVPGEPPGLRQAWCSSFCDKKCRLSLLGGEMIARPNQDTTVSLFR